MTDDTNNATTAPITCRPALATAADTAFLASLASELRALADCAETRAARMATERMARANSPVSPFGSNGVYGGPLVRVSAHYEDGSEKSMSPERWRLYWEGIQAGAETRAAQLAAEKMERPKATDDGLDGWIPVAETMPEYVGVLDAVVWRAPGGSVAIAAYRTREWADAHGYTHWFRLPAFTADSVRPSDFAAPPLPTGFVDADPDGHG